MDTLVFSLTFGVFASYNEAVWPAQYALAALAVGCMIAVRRGSYRVAFLVLGLLWLWIGLAYHWAFFAAVNPAAGLFAALSVAGSAVFFAQAVSRRPTQSSVPRSAAALGYALMIVGLAIYPAAALLAGQRYPAFPTFGLPCPTTVFTLGVLLATMPFASGWVFVVPLAWAGIGTVAAMKLGVVEDFVLPAAALATCAVLVNARSHRAVG